MDPRFEVDEPHIEIRKTNEDPFRHSLKAGTQILTYAGNQLKFNGVLTEMEDANTAKRRNNVRFCN